MLSPWRGAVGLKREVLESILGGKTEKGGDGG
jgi:hypothetical protein